MSWLTLKLLHHSITSASKLWPMCALCAICRLIQNIKRLFSMHKNARWRLFGWARTFHAWSFFFVSIWSACVAKLKPLSQSRAELSSCACQHHNHAVVDKKSSQPKKNCVMHWSSTYPTQKCWCKDKLSANAACLEISCGEGWSETEMDFKQNNVFKPKQPI